MPSSTHAEGHMLAVSAFEFGSGGHLMSLAEFCQTFARCFAISPAPLTSNLLGSSTVPLAITRQTYLPAFDESAQVSAKNALSSANNLNPADKQTWRGVWREGWVDSTDIADMVLYVRHYFSALLNQSTQSDTLQRALPAKLLLSGCRGQLRPA